MAKSKLFFSLDAIKPQESNAGGSIINVTSDEAPGFANISLASLKLSKGCIEEPIWHPNANKIGYCLAGNAQITIRGPNNAETFTIQQGDVFFIPKGYIHHIANIGPNENSIIFAWDHSKPEIMRLTGAIHSLSEDVFRTTFNTPAEFFKGLKNASTKELIKSVKAAAKSGTGLPSRYKFNIAKSTKTINDKGGYLQVATKGNLPILEGLGILGFGLNPKGIVEPHWHTNAGELIYIAKGKTRITVLSPDGNVETLNVNAGQGAFAPASHFHNIENVGNENVEVIAFFTSAVPDYIGIGEAVGAYSNDLLASIFNSSPNYFDQMKKIEEPVVIAPV